MESCLEPRALREESLQMWDLNKRLEAYLARVKFLEEENEALTSEIHRLKGSPPEGSWRAKSEEEVAAWRATLDEAFREKRAAELARASLHEEVQRVKSRCQEERAAREEAKKLLAWSKKEVEEEKRGHIWLRERAAQLAREMEALAEAHQEERARLDQEMAGLSWGLEGFRGTPVPFQPREVEDYSRRLANIWRGAVETYKTEVSQLEASLGEAKENLWKAAESNRQNHLQLQHLERELAGLKGRKEVLEERLAQQWQHQQGEAEKLQLAVEGLEEEKRALAVQIAQVLEDQRQLMHLKMSLSLEVATYRTLLEAESARLQMPADHKLAISLQDGKSEASNSKHQGVSLERGHLVSREPRPSSTTFSKGGVIPQPPKNQNGSFTVNIASVLPTSSRSPVAREFQKANTVLQSQSTKAFEGVDVPAFIDSAAFKLGSSPQNELMRATEAVTVSRSFIHESSPLFNSIRPMVSNVLGESSSYAGQSHHPGEDGDEISAQMETEELGKKVEPHEEVAEEEDGPGEQLPWEATAHHGPDPSQLVTEALEMARREVPGRGDHFEAGLFNVAETPNGFPSDDSLSVEEENGAAISPSTAALGEATPELHKSQVEDLHAADLPEGVNGCEDSGEAHRGPEAGMWVSRDAGASSLQETKSPEEEPSPSTQRNQEDITFDIPVTDEIDCCHRMSKSEQKEGSTTQPPETQGLVQRDEWEEGPTGTGPAPQLDTDAAATVRSDQDRLEPGPSCPEDHTGAIGADWEETSGGVEDLEVVSTEALHLSEDEERRALSSPSRESEEGDFQAEMLENEFLQTEEFAVETLSPISHSFYSAEGHQEHHFLGVEQETPEEQTPLSKSDSTLSEEEGKEVDLEPESSSAEEAVLRDEHSKNILSAEPRATEEAGAEERNTWEPQQDIVGHEGLLEEEGALGKEDTVEKKEITNLQDGTCEQETVLQKENVESLSRKETSKEEQGKETVEACQEDLPVDHWMEEEEIATKGEQGQEMVEAGQEDHPMDHRMEEEEITTKGEEGKETVGVCQEDLRVDHRLEEEEITTKGEEGKEIVEVCQEDLPVDHWMEKEEIATKGEQGQETVEACQEDHPVDHQMEEEEFTTKGEQGQETVEACQKDLPVDHRMEEEEITTKGEEGKETVEACQEDLPVDHWMEEEEIATKGEQGQETVEACQEDHPVDLQMEEEEFTTKGEQGQETVEACQKDLPVDHRVEEEEITTKGEQGKETVEACQEDHPVDHRMEEEEITTKGEEGKETVGACQEDLPVDHRLEEEEITTKGEEGNEPVEVCQGDLPVDHQVEEEEISTKGQQGKKTVEACQEDLPVDHQMEEEEFTTKGEEGKEIVGVYQEDLPVDHRLEEEEFTTKGGEGKETVEACQEDLPVDHRMEEEFTTKGEEGKEIVRVCQEDLPVDHRLKEEEITTKGGEGKETVEACQEDLPVDHWMEEEEITTKGEEGKEPVEACQEDLPVDHRVEEEEITTKGEEGKEPVEACQEDLPVDHWMEEEEITTKGEEGKEPVEACQEDLPVEHWMEEEEITTKGEEGKELVEVCQGDLPVDHQVEEEEISTKGEQGEETMEVCERELLAEQQEEEITMASPESDMLKREVLLEGSEAKETEVMEAKTSLAEKEETVGYVGTSGLQEKKNPEVKQAFRTDTPKEEEQHGTDERKETYPSQHALLHETNIGASEVPSEVQSNTTNGFEAKSYSGPQDVDMSSESDHQLQSDYSGSEVSLESLEVFPNATCETEGIEKDLESSKHIKLEETLPDNTPLHLYDEKILAVTGKGQLLAENEEAAGTLLLAKDCASSAEATEQAVEEVGPYSSQTENDDAKVLEGVDEERESAPKQDSPNSEELPVSKGLEEVKTETLEFIRNNEEDLLSPEPEMPNTRAYSPPLDAEFDEQPRETLKHGRGARKEPTCGEVIHEEMCSTDFVWETEGDNIFQADQPDPSYIQGDDSPLEFSDPNHIGSEGSHKVSPLTSVADLGEIVLEGEQAPDGQKDTAEFESLVCYEDESLLGAHESQSISALESCEREGPTQQTNLAEINSSGMDFTDPLPKAEASHPVDGLKACDILEIVEQALEFNQEVIKAAEQTVGAEQPAARADVPHSPEAESNGSSLASPDADSSQGFTETPNAHSSNAKDPTGSGPLWVENNGNGLQQDSRLPHFTTEMLNGIGDLHCGSSVYDVASSREELIEEVALSQHFHREDPDDLSVLETMSQNPLQTLPNEEVPSPGDTSSEIHRNVSLEHGGQEGLNVDKSSFAGLIQSAHMKGKDAGMEASSIPPHFGEEILHLESSQHLKFRPEDEEEFWSPEES